MLNLVRFLFPIVLPLALLAALLRNIPASDAGTIPVMYRLCTHLDFFQLAPEIKIGNGPDARKRRLESCVEVDEAFWSSVKKADLFPVRGDRFDRESDILGLIVFVSTKARNIPQGALLKVDVTPDGSRVLTVGRLPRVRQEQEEK